MAGEGRVIGQRALVLGGGIAGSLVARVLADRFAEVAVIERDLGYDPDGFRKGTPQARFVHGILRAGLDAMDALFPGFEQELYAGGAVPCRPARDLLFFDAQGLWPQHDGGLQVPLLSRALLEPTLARRLAAVPNVQVVGGASVLELIAGDDGAIAGAVVRHADGGVRRELADLVVDATGRAAHTPEWLRRLGHTAPEETRVEVDIRYAGCFVRPRRWPELCGAMVGEPPPHGRYGALVHAQEGGRLIVGVGMRGPDTPQPADFAALLALTERLPHPAVFELIRDAEPLTEIMRFGFPASVHRHYERIAAPSERLLCIGDAICSFNPVWGQGMSVAALQAQALGRMLEARAADGGSLAGLPRAFYAEAAQLIATPWQLSVGPDFAYATTRGERPPERPGARAFSRALVLLAKQDPQVRALTTDVFHLVRPLAALTSPELIGRLMPLMAEAETQAAP